MILHQLKSYLGLSEPVTREFVALMDSTFRPYGQIRSHFFEKLPHHLLQSELVSLVNVESKNRLFEERFCNGIQDSLKSLRRAIIRLEDLRAAHPGHPDTVNNLSQLTALAERVEALYQKHWEFYRYQGRLNEEELVGFLLEIDQVGYQWDIYLSSFSAVEGLAQALSGKPCPAEMAPLRVSYQRSAPDHFSVETLRALLGFLEAGYRFIRTVCEIDGAAHPLTLLQVEVAEPVELLLAVPKEAAGAYRSFLQHLFLKDMLRREPLLKVVFEAASREVGREKPLSPVALTAFQKELTAALKQLPQDGRFTISDRTFPDDGIRVLQEFTASLDEKQIRYDTLLRSDAAKGSRTRAAARPKEGAKPATPPAPPTPPAPSSPSKQSPAATYRLDGPGGLLHPTVEKEHIAVLTEKTREG